MCIYREMCTLCIPHTHICGTHAYIPIHSPQTWYTQSLHTPIHGHCPYMVTAHTHTWSLHTPIHGHCPYMVTHCVYLCIERLHITELRPFGDSPCPRRRVGCALIGSEFIICGGTRLEDRGGRGGGRGGGREGGAVCTMLCLNHKVGGRIDHM